MTRPAVVAGRRTVVGPRWAWVAIVTASIGGVVLSAVVSSGRPILASRWRLLWELGLWGVLWGVGVVAAFRLPRRAAVAAVLLGGVMLRLAALTGPPTTSDDLYRYSWDGRVQAAGIDPYAYPPDSPRLVALRERWLWPDAAGCAALHRPPGCTRINRPGQRTIYPPLGEAWFAAVYRVAGVRARSKAWQVAGLVTELAVLALLPRALRRWGRDERWVAVYALSPAPVLEIVNNGHVDGLAVLCVVAALTVAGRVPGMWARRGARPAGAGLAARSVWAGDAAVGALVGAAALVKLYPALLLAGVVGTGRRRVSMVRVGLVALAVAALSYLPHVTAAGVHVLGYLPGYLREEHYTTGGRFLLAGAIGVPARWAATVSVSSMVGACAWVGRRRPPIPSAFALLFGTLLLATTPVQPWYAVALLAVATVAGRPSWVAVVAAGYPYFFAVILASPHAVAIGRASFGGALLLVAVVSVVSPRHRGDVEDPVGVRPARAPAARDEHGRRERHPAPAVGVDEARQPAGRAHGGG